MIWHLPPIPKDKPILAYAPNGDGSSWIQIIEWGEDKQGFFDIEWDFRYNPEGWVDVPKPPERQDKTK